MLLVLTSYSREYSCAIVFLIYIPGLKATVPSISADTYSNTSGHARTPRTSVLVCGADSCPV